MLNKDTLLKSYQLMVTAKAMGDTFEANNIKLHHEYATSRGHEAIQIAAGLQLLSCDWVSPYYRDDSIMLSLGFSEYEMMLQLLAKKNDPFSSGRSYYCHPNNKDGIRSSIIHQSKAKGMQAIPATGLAQGIKFLCGQHSNLLKKGDNGENPIVLCSMGDGSITGGEVSEAIQFSVLKQLPIVYLVQDNQWTASASYQETRTANAFEFTSGFKGLFRLQCDGSDFMRSFETIQQAYAYAREERKPVLVHARVPLLTHHNSVIKKEFYRDREDMLRHALYDPLPKLRVLMNSAGFDESDINLIEYSAQKKVSESFETALISEDPEIETIEDNIFVPTTITVEEGERIPFNAEKVFMVDAAIRAIEELMEDHEEAILYGQDVGRRLGGIFRETASLAEKFGDERVFNTAVQEAYIVGSTVGLSAVGVKPIVEIQYGDFIYAGFNQLVSEVSKSCYLTNGKFPVGMVLRIPVGAYNGGGPYQSGSIESSLLSIKGIKIAYPSNAADMKGLMKAAFYDPNPVVMLEHKGIYWAKLPDTESSVTPEPAKNYILPLGKASVVLSANQEQITQGNTVCIITYGMGVYWAKAAAKSFENQVEVVDLRTLYPLDEDLVFERVKKHGKVIVLSEEQQNNSFAEALALRISNCCYYFLDAKVEVLGALNLPAVPTSIILENAMLPTVEKVYKTVLKLLEY